ncbi:MAG: DUF1552 domain-containing protein [Nannocystales bacterium]
MIGCWVDPRHNLARQQVERPRNACEHRVGNNQENALALFEQLFVPGDSPSKPTGPSELELRRKLVVDRVFAHWTELRHGAYGDAARLGSDDRARLDDVMDRLRDLQNRLDPNGQGEPVPSCHELEAPEGEPNGIFQWEGGSAEELQQVIRAYQTLNEVIAVGLLCGTNRVASLSVSNRLHTLAGDWHDIVMHNVFNEQPHQWMLESQQTFFRDVFLDLCRRLEVDEGDGTVLDNTLVVGHFRHGAEVHWCDSAPIVTAGSAGGRISTGSFIDYRNHQNTSLQGSSGENAHVYRRPGLLLNQWFGTVLQAFGVPEEQYIQDGGFYGVTYVQSSEAHSASVLAQASEPLPYLLG